MQITIQIDTNEIEKRTLVKTADFLRSLSMPELKGAFACPPNDGDVRDELDCDFTKQKIIEDPKEVFNFNNAETGSSIGGETTGNVRRGNGVEFHDPDKPVEIQSGFNPNSYSTELDAEGLPWDDRIHTRTKSTTKDGLWRVKRNIDAAFEQAIKQELRSIMAIPTHTSINDIVATKRPLPPKPKYAEQEIPLDKPKPPKPPATATHATFESVMSRVGTALTTGNLTREQFAQILLQIDPALVNPLALSHARHLAPQVDEALTRVIGI